MSSKVFEGLVLSILLSLYFFVFKRILIFMLKRRENVLKYVKTIDNLVFF